MAEISNATRPTEDVIQYKIFPRIPENLQLESLKEYLHCMQDDCLAFISPMIVDHIWQNEPFHFILNTDEGDLPPHFDGETNFGDNIEDEWFIVYLLLQLTKNFSDLVVRVADNDGEFLLIEAAHVLPKWLKPETADNRVYLYNGKVHIIPIPQSPADVTCLPLFTPTMSEGVKCVRQNSTTTQASEKIQNSIQRRLESFPQSTKENIHYAHCYVPASIAAILEHKPNLISAAVHAFYYRDPMDLQACRTFQYFRPGTRVMTRVRFTRCLYAQLMQQDFQPDKRSGYSLPQPSSAKFKSHNIGMKLAHGFEILCSRCKANRQKQNGASLQSSVSDVRWNRYLQSLKEKGYFKGEIEGSRKYKQYLEEARKFYISQIQPHTNNENDKALEILDLLETLKYDIEAYRQKESSLLPPDDDSWLTLSPEEFDSILYKAARMDNNHISEENFDLSKISDCMKTFVENVSDIDGAEFPREGEEGDINFDSTGFIHSMQKMFEFDDKHSDSSSDMSEYDWDDKMDLELSPSPPKYPSKQKKDKKMSSYMSDMDRELAKTDVGKSFEQESNKKPPKPSDIDDEDDDFTPVNIDVNVVQNMLKSYNAQVGEAGPASNILHSMGVKLPPNSDP